MQIAMTAECCLFKTQMFSMQREIEMRRSLSASRELNGLTAFLKQGGVWNKRKQANSPLLNFACVSLET